MRESLLKVNSVFHVVIGAYLMNRGGPVAAAEAVEGRTTDHVRCLKLVLDYDANVNSRDSAGFSPLLWAVWAPPCPTTAAVVDLLLARGADPNSRSRTGMTPLMMAVRQGHLGYVKLLLERGGDPTLRNTDGVSILEAARDAPEIMAALVVYDKINNPVNKGNAFLNLK